MRKLVLVRHSKPEIEPGVPAAKWRLSERGRRSAESLAAGLCHYRANAIWSSREPKAQETAQIIGRALGLPLRVTDGLEEHHRRNVPCFQSTQEFERAVEHFFSQPDRLILGSETAIQARDRVTTAIESVLEGDNQDAIVVTHGRVMALFLARVANVEPMSFWRKLETPCFVEVEIPRMRVGPIVACGQASRSGGRGS